MKVALVSLDQAWQDKETNKKKCCIVSRNIKAACPDINLIIYPELTLTGFSIDNSRLAEIDSQQSETVSFFSELSKLCQCHHVFGQLVSLESGHIVNRQNVTTHHGSLVSRYDKIHTFSYAGESEHISQGQAPAVFPINDVNIGSSICYDLRFAELYNYYRDKTEIVINTANWPSTRTEQWLCLLQARAIENQYYVIGVNRVGTDGKGLHYDSSSVIYNPLGEKQEPMLKGDDWNVYDIDVKVVSSVRMKFPFIKDRRNQLYREISKVSSF